MGGPAGPAAGVWFVLTMVLATLCVNAFFMLVYVSSFYTINPMGIRIVAATVTEFLSGSIIPLPFLPQPLQAIVNVTPFAAMQNLPLRIYSGDIAGGDLAAGVLLQVFWLVVMTVGGWLLMKKALTRVVVQGG